MNKYLDDDFTILDNTLLACKSRGKVMHIPGDVSGQEIRRIGAGLSLEDLVQEVEVGEGIREIGNGAFTGSMSLKKVVLPESLEACEEYIFNKNEKEHSFETIYLKRRLTAEEYHVIQQSGIAMVNGWRLLKADHRQMPAFSGIYKGFSSYGAPVMLESSMGGLYMTWDVSSKVEELCFLNQRSPFDGKNCGFIKKRLPCTELCRQLLAQKTILPKDQNSELAHDRRFLSKFYKSKDPVMLSDFQETEVREEGNEWHLTIRIRVGFVFFPEMVKIVMEGQQYYIYREHYLSSNGKMPFYSVDPPNAVFDGQGKAVPEKTAKKVMGKYQFMSMLM